MCILVVAFNLRLSLAGVGPLIHDIQQTFSMSNASLGLLTTLPLLLFGCFSLASSRLILRVGLRRTLLWAMLVLSVGIVVRVVHVEAALFVGSALIGLAIALGNVSLPALTKRCFPEQSGKITGAYSATMSIGAALGAGLSIPISHNFGLGWQYTLGLAGIFSIIALLICAWKLQVDDKKAATSSNTIGKVKSLWRNALAWQVAIFMGCQSFTFYVILAWLPSVLIDRGFTPAYSGWMLAIVQLTGIAGALLVPMLAGRKNSQRTIVVTLCILEAAALVGILVATNGMVLWLCGLIGFVLGGTFSLSLMFLVLRADTSFIASKLSGFAQAIGYTIAAAGPFLFGYIHDITFNWDASLVMLLVILIIKFIAGLGAGQAKSIQHTGALSI